MHEKIGIFWVSTTDNTKNAALFIKLQFELKGLGVDIFNVDSVSMDKILAYDHLIFGCSTWHGGELPDDWDALFVEFF